MIRKKTAIRLKKKNAAIVLNGSGSKQLSMPDQLAIAPGEQRLMELTLPANILAKLCYCQQLTGKIKNGLATVFII
jgi:hypothetical protein